MLFLLRMLEDRDRRIDTLEKEREEWQEITSQALEKERDIRRDVREMLLAVRYVLTHPDEHREQCVDPVAYAGQKVIEALARLDEAD